MKCKIMKLLFTIAIFFSFSIITKAQGIYDIIQSGDIIIGNTVFRKGLWLSQAQVNKAKELYTNNTGNTNVYIYKFVAKGIWYEQQNDGTFKIVIDGNRISEIENNLKIIYENNIPISNTSYQNNTTDVKTVVIKFLNMLTTKVFYTNY